MVQRLWAVFLGGLARYLPWCCFSGGLKCWKQQRLGGWFPFLFSLPALKIACRMPSLTTFDSSEIVNVKPVLQLWSPIWCGWMLLEVLAAIWWVRQRNGYSHTAFQQNQQRCFLLQMIYSIITVGRFSIPLFTAESRFMKFHRKSLFCSRSFEN